MLHWVKYSKRFIPEAILALRQALEFAQSVDGDAGESEDEKFKFVDVVIDSKASMRKVCSETALSYAQLYTSLPGYIEIFSPLIPLVDERERTPLETSLSNSQRQRRPLELQKHRAIGLQSFVPKFEDGFNPDKKSYDRDADRQRASKLKAEVRDARRGAVRVLRRDAAFEARAKAGERKTKSDRYRSKMGKIEGRLRQPDF